MNPVFFTDRDLGKQFPAILAAAGLTVETHSSHFGASTPDEDWLRVVGQRGWVAVTHDKRIRYKPNELAAVMANNVALLVVVGHAPFAELARSFVASRARIEAFLNGNDPPYIAKLYRSGAAEPDTPLAAGRIEKWYPPS
ncbi:MAG: PIN-like domain-containing protein [Gemmatimonadales bacterium]